MKLYRYMSEKEFSKLTAGVEMTNNCHHFNCSTGSDGFCFLPDVQEVTAYDFYGDAYPVQIYAEEAHNFLFGLTTLDVLVEFETTNENVVNESWGRYANPFTDDYDDYIYITEYCCNKYSRENLIPKRYAMVDFWGPSEWYSVN